MFNIYDMMKSGMSADEIASVFTQNLNDAEAKIKAEEAEAARLAAEAALAEQERINAQAAKRQEFEQAVCDLLCAIACYYPELGIGEEDVTSETVAAVTDLILMLLDIEAMKGSKRKKKEKAPVDPFDVFFKQFGLS